ncbi:hypothetical protein EVAR_67194_1 [Eumeta japonica]|uniref:Uncharacterized protein n=1 Tax=Eumeta variegata TaxID=151549 RepID=A0A4C2A3Z7_EUMVA|nr:hypothetical protein EVAR_67194_1 [Eumeta japonica]
MVNSAELENGPPPPVSDHTLAEHRLGVTAFTVGFRRVVIVLAAQFPFVTLVSLRHPTSPPIAIFPLHYNASLYIISNFYPKG